MACRLNHSALGVLASFVALTALGCAPPPASIEPLGSEPLAGEATFDASGPAPTPAPSSSEPLRPCCRVCYVNQTCANACIDPSETCARARGCACTPDEFALDYQAREFEAGEQVGPGTGILGPDVYTFNAAQGDPIQGPFTLAQAFAGDESLADRSLGVLRAVFETSMGRFECELFERETPLAVANFVGLARGVRPFRDPRNPGSDTWKAEPYYDGTVFHRAIPNFIIQAGDPTGLGTGTPGYLVPDEFDPRLRFDGPGVLAMSNRNPYERETNLPVYDEATGMILGNTGSGQFFITVAALPALNDRHTIFGVCETKLAIEMSEVRTVSGPPSKPAVDIVLERLTFLRR